MSFYLQLHFIACNSSRPQYAVIETIMKWKSLCVFCHASFYVLLDTIADVWIHGRRFKHKTTDAKRN